jgi:hypothetical protein
MVLIYINLKGKNLLDILFNLPLCLQYEEQYPAFGGSRESKLIKTLSKTLEDQDVEAFTGLDIFKIYFKGIVSQD